MVCKVSRGNRYVDLDIDSDSDELEEYEADLEEDAQEVGYASEPTAGILDQVIYIFYLLDYTFIYLLMYSNILIFFMKYRKIFKRRWTIHIRATL